MGKDKLQKHSAQMAELVELISECVCARVEGWLAPIPGQIAKHLKTEMENTDFIEKFNAREKKKRHEANKKADASPVRKSDKKKKSEKKKAATSDTPKAAKKRKDPKSPKGVRNKRTMFKLARSADFAGLSRDDRQKKEKEMFNALTPEQLKVYEDQVVEDEKRYAREMALYEKGEYVPSKVVVQPPAPASETKGDVAVAEKKKKPTRKAKAAEAKKNVKAAAADESSDSSSSEDSDGLSEQSDD